MQAVVDDQVVTWTERRLVIHSFSWAQKAQERLRGRLAQAQQELARLNQRGPGRRRYTEIAALRQAAEGIVTRYDVQQLVQLTYQEMTPAEGTSPPITSGRSRKGTDLRVCVAVDEQAVRDALRVLGWRIYATNQPGDGLTLTQAVLAYRGEYVIEHGFGRLKGKPLSLTPMYLQDDGRATGLIRLLSIGLRVLSVVEFAVRSRLAQEAAKLAGLYAGNPKRATGQPTAEKLLEAFKELTLTIVKTGEQTWFHMTPLSGLQQQILALLDLPSDLYTKLCNNPAQPP